jgi:hypothetical protein
MLMLLMSISICNHDLFPMPKELKITDLHPDLMQKIVTQMGYPETDRQERDEMESKIDAKG